MNLSKDTIKTIMSIAQNLQKQYDILGCPGTQNVRNPYPLHKLVVGVLPTRKSQGLTVCQIKEKLESWGYRIKYQSLHVTICKMASNMTINREWLKVKELEQWAWHYSFVP